VDFSNNFQWYACEPAVKSFLSTIFIVEQSSAVRIVLCITPVWEKHLPFKRR
jgi:hypothetical protein